MRETGNFPARTSRYVERDNAYDPNDGPYYYGYGGRLSSPGRSLYARNGSIAPTGEELLRMDYPQVWNVARTAAIDFDRWLRTIPAGGVWRKHFEMPTLLELLAGNTSVPPADSERQNLVRILGVFDKAVVSDDLNDLSSEPSVSALRSALRELATPSEQRLVRQLSLNGRALNRTLGAVSTGVTWQ